MRGTETIHGRMESRSRQIVRTPLFLRGISELSGPRILPELGGGSCRWRNLLGGDTQDIVLDRFFDRKILELLYSLNFGLYSPRRLTDDG